MAKIIYEKREFTDRNTGIKTEYDYIAIAGTGEDAHQYEVALKNLVQSEKMALQMIANLETGKGEVTSRRANENEQVNVSTNSSDDSSEWLDELQK